ncbi:SDR family NAD(P)-dependent oxidoreductase [Paractinoplanes lichenicola]|uniref:SDR family NAD(P)-dependent oxidoreductase n=1 Tax=Paractinoplanes lichenicola TaxID=2802976 RepID=A0ABS1W1E8_9ACTN|nr:SDR family NAD(P)-dependent oxidoreductase [Actinoplanes lichenicola]MBL7260518.1 SDR family NAD(P)-dependent oxidoreductase [Actinoplanes lichenicola]
MKYDRTIVWNPVHPDSLNLANLNVAVVGGTGGIGRALSRFLASRGAQVTVVGRTFRDADVPGITFVPADLSLMREAARVAEQLPAENLDLLVFTTGIIAAPQREETAEGIERDMAVSYLSRLVILRGIAARLGADRPRNNGKPRVFVMGFPGSGKAGTYDDLNAEKSYKSMDVHMNTVAGNEILVLDAAQRYPGIDTFGLHPGVVKSDIRANLMGKGSFKHRAMETVIGLVTSSAETYARRIAPLLVSPDLTDHSGAMFNNKGRAIQPTDGMNPQHVAGFLRASEQLVATVKGELR